MHNSSTKKSVFPSIVLSIGVILIVGAIATSIYFNARKKEEPIVETPVIVFNWNENTEAIAQLAKTTFADISVGERGSITIEEKGDVTGDGVVEAFVDLGTGGASTSVLTLVMTEGDSFSIARMKDIEGVVRPFLLTEGAAAMHQESIGMTPADNMVYQKKVFINADTQEVGSCTFDAYLWDSRQGLFAYNPDASLNLQATYCISSL